MSEIDSSVNSSMPRNTAGCWSGRCAGRDGRLLGAAMAAACDARHRGRNFPCHLMARLWLWLPPIGRAIALCGFAVLTAAACVPFIRVRFPSRYDGLRRLDRNTGLLHRPATAMSDELATPNSDPWSTALWRAHVERALLAARTLRAGRPAPRLDLRDPIRPCVRCVLACGDDLHCGRRRARPAPCCGVRLARCRRAGEFPARCLGVAADLHGEASGDSARPAARRTRPNVGCGSVVPAGQRSGVRASARSSSTWQRPAGLLKCPPSSVLRRRPAPRNAATHHDRGTATGARPERDDLTYAFNAIPDKPPVIALTKDPEPQASGSLQLNYKMEDDYGVVEAKALFALKKADTGDASKGGDAGGPRPLFAPPEMQLTLPQARVKNGVGQTTKDLSDHPWAGAEVTITLTARDDANNEGTSGRTPCACGACVRQAACPCHHRAAARSLARCRNPDRVLIVLDALAMAPDKFMPELGHYLGLRSLYWQLAQAKSDDDLREAVKQMWAYATMPRGRQYGPTRRRACATPRKRCATRSERGASDEELKRSHGRVARRHGPVPPGARRGNASAMRVPIPTRGRLGSSIAESLTLPAASTSHSISCADDRPPDGAPGAERPGWRRRHDVDARRARRHDPQGAAVTR